MRDFIRVIEALREARAAPIVVFDHPHARLALKAREHERRRAAHALVVHRHGIEHARFARLKKLVACIDAYVALGVVIRGETYHFEIVSNESARGIMALTMDGIPIGNGILTTENEEQAIRRADPAQLDKGGGAAQAAIAMLQLQQRFA